MTLLRNINFSLAHSWIFEFHVTPNAIKARIQRTHIFMKYFYILFLNKAMSVYKCSMYFILFLQQRRNNTFKHKGAFTYFLVLPGLVSVNPHFSKFLGGMKMTIKRWLRGRKVSNMATQTFFAIVVEAGKGRLAKY